MSFSLEQLKKQNNLFPNGKKEEIAVKTERKNSLRTLQEGIFSRQMPLETRIQKDSKNIIAKTSQQLRENSIELIFLIDASNSCSGLENATCLGYDKLIKEEKRKDGCTKVSTILFSHVLQEKGFRQNIAEVPPLNYRADGGTALYDAFCSTILKIKEARNKDSIKPNKTLVAIMTDGVDEHSCTFSLEQTRNLIQSCQKEGWEFIFLGSFKNAKAVAENLGIRLENSVETQNSMTGTLDSFASIQQALEDLKKYGSITSNWSRRIQKPSLEEKEQKRLGLK